METLARLRVRANGSAEGRSIPGPSLQRDLFLVIEAGKAASHFAAPGASRYSVHDDSILAERLAKPEKVRGEGSAFRGFKTLWQRTIGGAA